MKVKYSIANVFRKLELLVCGSIAGQLDGVAKLFLLKMLVKLQVYAANLGLINSVSQLLLGLESRVQKSHRAFGKYKHVKGWFGGEIHQMFLALVVGSI